MKPVRSRLTWSSQELAMDKNSHPLPENFKDQLENMMADAKGDNVYGMIYKLLKSFPTEKFSLYLVIKEVQLWGLKNQKTKTMDVIGEVTARLINDRMLDKYGVLSLLHDVIYATTSQSMNYDENIWKMFASFLMGFKRKHPLTLWVIHLLFIRVIADNKGYFILKEIFILNQGAPYVIDKWWNEGSIDMVLLDWMPEDDAQAFNIDMGPFHLARHSPAIKTVQDPQTACSRLLKYFQLENKTDWIMSWINTYVRGGVLKPWFVRALTEAVFTYALCPSTDDDNLTVLNYHQLYSYYPLLTHYVCYDMRKEIECLRAVQHLMHKLKHPQGITESIFIYLWESGDVVTHRTFYAWKVDNNPHERDGKDIMLKTLRTFYTMISMVEFIT